MIGLRAEWQSHVTSRLSYSISAVKYLRLQESTPHFEKVTSISQKYPSILSILHHSKIRRALSVGPRIASYISPLSIAL